MVNEIITSLLNDLSKLLAEDLSPHLISSRFAKLSVLLSRENLTIEKLSCKEYYEDRDLALVLLMKNEALENGQFELATKFYLLEKELLEEKGDTELTRLKTESFFFEFKANRVIFHFNKKEENQRLIANLIEGYNLANKNTRLHHKIAC